MPFWWRRRNKPWYTSGRFRRYRTRPRRRKYQRRRRRQPRRPARRRRRYSRRKYKVRRKKRKVTLQQWQPDSIRKCKIKGFGILVAGSQGSQYRCYSDNKLEFTQPKAPGGGSFGIEIFSLQYLYNEWKARHNIWTHSNDYKDLCRYTGCKIHLYRHPTTDFIINYDIQPPFKLETDTYIDMHPQNLLLARHKRILLSTKTKPTGRPHITLKIRPPKLMQTKWYFQETFAPAQLVKLSASACNFGHSIYGPNTQSTNVTLLCLNTNFYQHHDWSNTKDTQYLPYSTYPTHGLRFWPAKGEPLTYTKPTNYPQSVNKETGFFQTKILTAVKVTDLQSPTPLHNKPITVARYNPTADTGEGNAVWIVDTFSASGWLPQAGKFQIAGVPLYMAFLGFTDYITRTTADKGILTHSIVVCKSKAIKVLTPHEQTVFPFIDSSFVYGKMPYDEELTLQQINNWYPTVEKQLQTINGIVSSGPLSPKYSNLPDSTWQLTYRYTFYFKWGGPKISDYTVQNPEAQGTYPIPDKLYKTIQVADPLKQAYKAMLRQWDQRRGIITKTAIKRMSENLQVDSVVSSDDSEPEKKKKRVTSQIPVHNQEEEETQTCLLSLFEESTSPPTENIQQLIQYQQQQQQKLKYNIIQLLTNLKSKQRMLEMQTGLF
nr:MAG: ORF1 [Torque teno midi virus]